MTTGGFTGAGTGFTTRIITVPDADIVDDRVVTSTGSYSATATQSGGLGHAGRHVPRRRSMTLPGLGSVRGATSTH